MEENKTFDVVSPRGMAYRLQVAASVATIGACLVLAGAAVWMIASAQRTARPSAPAYSDGERMDAVPGVDFSESRQTLVLAVQENCGYCKASVPFYHRLTSALKGSPTAGTRLVVVSTDPVASTSAVLQAGNIRADSVQQVAPGALKIPGTPYLVLVDRSGTVRRTWRGMLSSTGETDVFAALSISPSNN